MADLPKRPRLAEHALARGHRLSFERKLRVVLHDAESDAVVDVGLREWLVLAAADGTRDIEGLTLAANREGARLTPEAVTTFLHEVAGLGWLEDGLADARATAPTSAVAPSNDTPIERLAGFSLHCDGRGACCRFYPTVLFSSHETAKARAACPTVLDGATRQEQVFFPSRGSDGRAGLAVVVVDGRCAYLDSADKCAIHAAAGAEAKPLGCQAFPAEFIDDGKAIRIAPALECACVFASIDRAGGEPLVPESIRRRADLDPAIHVEALGPVVVASEGRVETVDALRAWTDAIVSAKDPVDPLAAAWNLAEAVEQRGLDCAAAELALRATNAPDPIDVLPWVVALGARAATKAHENARYRASTDLAAIGMALVARASLALVEGGLARCLAPPPDPTREAFALRVHAFVYGAARRRAIDVALRDFATQLLVARSLGEILGATPHHEALREPIAVVRSVVRAHGIASYLDDL